MSSEKQKRLLEDINNIYKAVTIAHEQFLTDCSLRGLPSETTLQTVLDQYWTTRTVVTQAHVDGRDMIEFVDSTPR
jgi:hypothetical protein